MHVFACVRAVSAETASRTRCVCYVLFSPPLPALSLFSYCRECKELRGIEPQRAYAGAHFIQRL